ncbi:MAG: hypothetical protein M3396_05745 [Actinomycetota bacterium]|nr:hypothetical protein [Actinomycetota bacterium]MDQ3575758.1 hypothetical protein [Actinomycetota bacterium]
MFVQVIQGRTSDAEAVKEQFDRWYEELGSDAEGYLGTTGGVSSDGDLIVLARFESEEAARANSERSEQQSWWEETSKLFEGNATFHDCDDVETYLEGGSDDAGFVQVIQGRVTDRDRYTALQQELQENLQEERPEVLGMLQAWDEDFVTTAVYFASEHTAREGEGKAMPDDRLEKLEEMRTLAEDLTYTDLEDPWLLSPKSDEDDEDS